MEKFRFKLYIILIFTTLCFGIIFKDSWYHEIFYKKIFIEFDRENSFFIENKEPPYTYITKIRGDEVYNLSTKEKNMTINFKPLDFDEVRLEEYSKGSIKLDSLMKILDIYFTKQKDTNYYKFYIVDIDSINQKAKISKSIPQKIYIVE